MRTLKSFSSITGVAVALLLMVTGFAAQASIIWNGPTNGFFGTNTPDPILPNVYFNRLNGGSTSGGLFNDGTNAGTFTAIETSATAGTSPAGTAWSASGNTLISYAGIGYGACPLEHRGNPSQYVGHSFVVHLFTNDIFMQLTLTNWGGVLGIGSKTFGYTRSSPTVPPSIINPLANTNFSAPANVLFQATVLTNIPVQFTNVEFFTNNVLMGSVTSNPFNFTANNLGAGSYAVTAVEIAAGNFTTSSIVNFTVTASANVGIGITNPANNEVFSAPANVAIQPGITNGDSVTSVQFYSNNALLGSAGSTPFDFTNSFTAGSYSLTAVAIAGGINTTSGAVGINVVTPTPVLLGSSTASGLTNFGFNYAANVGLSYVVQVSTNLSPANWVSLVTNTATSNPAIFADPNATNGAGFYRVGLLPNP